MRDLRLDEQNACRFVFFCGWMVQSFDELIETISPTIAKNTNM